jgi:hypothetical protein
VTVRNIRSVVAVLSVSLLAVGLQAAPAEAVTPRVPHERSGMRWASGTFVSHQTRTKYDAFGRWRKAKTDVAVTFPGRGSWPEIVSPTWLYDDFKKSPTTLVLSLPPFPEKGRFSLRACARGSYDKQWRRFGTGIARAGLASRTVVRLGWEFNGSWVPWAAHDPQAFVGCWRRVFTAAESKAPKLRWDWTVNRGDGDALVDARKAWPGKKYVDFVGIDSYDGWPPVLGKKGWNAQYAGAYGLKFWADFARRKGKRLSVPEWGLLPGTAWQGNNGGDNAYYIRKMFWFFNQQRGNLAYEAYFNDDDPSHKSALTLNPKGGKEYRKLIVKYRSSR